MSLIALARYNSDGVLDDSFHSNGLRFINIRTELDRPGAVVLDPSGRILVAGGDGGFGVARILANGNVDPSFGNNGIQTTDWSREFQRATCLALRVDSSGDYKIFVGGAVSNDTAIQAAVACYGSDGRVDTSFGTQGLATTETFAGRGMSGNAVVVDANGRVIVGGTLDSSSPALARFNSDGTIDTSFGNLSGNSAGIASASFVFSFFGDGAALAIDVQQALVAVGGIGYLTKKKIAVARFLPVDGQLDTSFDGNGKAAARFWFRSAFGRGLAIDSSNQIVAVGGVYGPFSFGGNSFGVMRFRTDGDLDNGFSGNGKFRMRIRDSSQAFAAAIDQNNRIVVAGSAWEDGREKFALIRLLRAGLLDVSFGSGGVVVTSFGAPNHARALGIAIDASGKIIVSGIGGQVEIGPITF